MKEKLQHTLVSQLGFDDITEVIANFAERARREGVLLAFKEIVEVACDEVLRQNIQMVVDGVAEEQKRALLEPQMQAMMQYYNTRYRMIFEGVMAIRGEEHPRVVEQKLQMFYVPARKERASYTKASLTDLKKRLQKTPFSQLGFDEVAEVFTDLSIIARSKKIAALENVVELIDDRLLVQGLRLAISDIAPETIRHILERRVQTLLHHHKTQYGMIFEGITAIQRGEHPRIIEQKVRSFYE